MRGASLLLVAMTLGVHTSCGGECGDYEPAFVDGTYELINSAFSGEGFRAPQGFETKTLVIDSKASTATIVHLDDWGAEIGREVIRWSER